MPESWSGDDAPGLDFAREAGPAGAVTIAITPVGEAPGLIDILIDRRLMGSGVIRDGSVHLTGATAEGIARAMANARVLTLRARRRVIATISLGGASAATRYIDSEQGRAGGVTALVAKGPKSAAAVPGAIAVPKVAAVRPPKGKPEVLTPAQIVTLAVQAQCETDTKGFTPEFHRLDRRSTLAMIPCGTSAYQQWDAIFVITDGRAAPARFALSLDGAKDPVPLLTMAGWDPANGVLTSHHKGRGLGDCGTDERWVWDGAQFRLIRYTALIPCRMSGNWLTHYRAEPVYK